MRSKFWAGSHIPFSLCSPGIEWTLCIFHICRTQHSRKNSSHGIDDDLANDANSLFLAHRHLLMLQVSHVGAVQPGRYPTLRSIDFEMFAMLLVNNYIM